MSTINNNMARINNRMYNGKYHKLKYTNVAKQSHDSCHLSETPASNSSAIRIAISDLTFKIKTHSCYTLYRLIITKCTNLT